MSLSLGLDEVLGTVLVMVRLLGAFMLAPFFGHNGVPIRVRAGLAMAVALALGPRFGALPAELDLGLAVLHEVLVGLSIGFSAAIVFAGIGLAGELMSIQGGLGAATVLDPTSGASSVVMTSMVQLFSLLFYLAAGGHHELIRAITLSFEQLPLGGVGPSSFDPASVVAMGGVVFEIAVRLAAPITAAMLLANISVGILGRTIPQLNLMALQLPAHVGVTFLLMGLGASFFGDEVQRIFEISAETVVTLIGGRG